MAHSRSTPIWNAIGPLAFVQFPWRFLALVIFAFSFVAGSMVFLVKAKWMQIVMGMLCIFLVVFNWHFFRPETGKMGPITDEQKFTGIAWDMQRTAGIFDYLPLTAKENPRDGYKQLVDVISGDASISNAEQGTNWGRFNIDAPEESVVRINIYQFPNWKVFIDGQEVPNYIPEEEKWGRMYITVPEGQHLVEARLYSTQVRTVANAISLMTWIGLGVFVVWKRKELFK